MRSVLDLIIGTGFARYELALAKPLDQRIAPLGSESFSVIASGTSAIANGKLGTIPVPGGFANDPTLLQNDAYTLRLLVYGTNGTVQTIVISWSHLLRVLDWIQQI